MPGQNLSNIMASSGLGDKEAALNLHNLYPQSQSPMSFKQMQKAKRQKRAGGSFIGNVPAMQGSVVQNRQSANGSQINANQSPLHQFYATSKNQGSRQ